MLDLAGLVLILLAFADVAGSSIPPQDATPAVSAAHEASIEKASAHLVEALILAAVLGAISTVLIVLGVRARRRHRQAAAHTVGPVERQ